MAEFDSDSMLSVFTFEMNQLLAQLEQSVLKGEDGYSMDEINDIFRVMHTIKGSAGMMNYHNISVAAHAIEDLFFYLREENPQGLNYGEISDLVLMSADFIKAEIAKLEAGEESDGDDSENIEKIKAYLAMIKGETAPAASAAPPPAAQEPAASAPQADKKQRFSGTGNRYAVTLFFEEGCEMENVRAFTVVRNLGDIAPKIESVPADLIDTSAIDVIRKDGLKLDIWTDADYDTLCDVLGQTIYLRELKVELVQPPHEHEVHAAAAPAPVAVNKQPEHHADPAKKAEPPKPGEDKKSGQQMISVNVTKLDDLLKLMGELVISESMVTQNPDLDGIRLDSFQKEARQLRNIIKDMQLTVMNLRMVPLSTTFFKMHRIVRDISKNLGKEINLELVGENTEVDKNVVEHISDPLMHIIRNSADHGIEKPDERAKAGKNKQGTILLEARSSGSDVSIIVKDDGAGLDLKKILRKAANQGLLTKPEEDYTDKEICQFIFMPGFSTNEVVTEFSGRGVGMDVVNKNLELIDGKVLVDTQRGEGSTFTMKIPLNLAIIDGMLVRMGGNKYVIPILSIRDSFKAKAEALFADPNGNEMITVRDEVYNVVKLYDVFGMTPKYTDIEDGILIMIENGEQSICLFVDELIGQQQVVLKNLPKYINNVRGVSGCTLLGNGDISLILDVAGFFEG